MLNTILRKRAHLSAAVIAISLLMIATTAFAVTKLIEAKKGGTLEIAEGVELVVPPQALEEDTIISADMKMKSKSITFKFKPDGTVFVKPAKLQIAWSAIQDVDDLTLYEKNGDEIEPRITGWGLEYEISHFSLYYFRRR